MYYAIAGVSGSDFLAMPVRRSSHRDFRAIEAAAASINPLCHNRGHPGRTAVGRGGPQPRSGCGRAGHGTRPYSRVKRAADLQCRYISTSIKNIKNIGSKPIGGRHSGMAADRRARTLRRVSRRSVDPWPK